MDEFLMREFQRNRNMGISDEDFMRKMKEYFQSGEFPRWERMRRREQGMEEFMGESMEGYENSNRYRNAERQRNQGGSQSYRFREKMGELMEELQYMGQDEKKKFVEMILGGESGGHFEDAQAEYIVSKMYHTENGKKYMGEKFSMEKAREVWGKYKSFLSKQVTHADIYVAINAQYHDYCELFKTWFGDGVDSKIIESAIEFWFKDDDWKGGSKIWKYFKEA